MCTAHDKQHRCALPIVCELTCCNNSSPTKARLFELTGWCKYNHWERALCFHLPNIQSDAGRHDVPNFYSISSRCDPPENSFYLRTFSQFFVMCKLREIGFLWLGPCVCLRTALVFTHTQTPQTCPRLRLVCRCQNSKLSSTWQVLVKVWAQLSKHSLGHARVSARQSRWCFNRCCLSSLSPRVPPPVTSIISLVHRLYCIFFFFLNTDKQTAKTQRNVLRLQRHISNPDSLMDFSTQQCSPCIIFFKWIVRPTD